MRCITPFWDWSVEDHGGLDEYARLNEVRFNEAKSRQRWYVAELENEVIGFPGFSLRKRHIGQFFGVWVLPEHRMRRVGSTLIQVALKEAKKAGLENLRVYTMAFLDRFAPRVILYLKSG